MEREVRTKAKIAFLNEEMDAIHHANNLYWKQGKAQTPRPKPNTILATSAWKESESSLPNFVLS
jgi:hypothetical protein